MSATVQSEVQGARVGGFSVFTGVNPYTGEDFILLIKRGGKYEGTGRDRLGVLGGHLDIEIGEQPIEGLLREIREELLDADGIPVLTGLVREEFRLVATGMDYTTRAKHGEWQAGNHWSGWTYRLSGAQVQQLIRHVRRLGDGTDYRQRVGARSNFEIEDVILEPVATLRGTDLKALAQDFAYDHEAQVVLEVANRIG